MDQPNTTHNVDPPHPVAPTPPPASSQPTWNDSISQVDTYAEKLRVMLPQAPPGVLDGYMRFAPWIAIIFGALGVVFSLLFLLLGAAMSPLLVVFGGAAGASYSGALLLTLLVGLLINVLEIVGGYLMLQRKLTGWWLLAVGMLVSVLQSLFGRSVLVLIVVLLIAYVHLQVKPNYHA
jgi:hypothetical protein